MQKLYYFDTCIWRDHFETRFGQGGRPLGDYATRLIQKIMKNKDLIIYSTLILDELLLYHELEEVKEMITFLVHTGTLKKIDISYQDHILATRLSDITGIHKSDAMHAILAKKHNAILISQDKHFLLVEDFVQVKKPEDII